MSTPDLTPTLRSALEKISRDPVMDLLTDSEIAALDAVEQACPKPRWLPTEDGLAEHVDSAGGRKIYYVRDGRVGVYLHEDGTLFNPCDPADYRGTWEPYVHEVTPEQINDAAWGSDCYERTIRATLPHLGCREVTR